MNKKYLLFIVFLVLVTSVSARDLYVDQKSTTGPCNDATTRANNDLAHPWCTINAANLMHIPGDHVYILPGEYHDFLLPLTGTPSSYTVYSGYGGNRSNVIVKGSVPLSNWQAYNANIYYAHFSNDFTPRCGIQSTDCFEDRKKWLSRASTLAELNQPGEYYYDDAASRVYYWSSDNQSPSSHLMECSNITVGAWFDTYYGAYLPRPSGAPSYVTIQNLTIMHSYDDGFVMSGIVHDVNFLNNEFAFNSGGGSCSSNPASIHHDNGGNPQAPGFIIKGNIFHDQGSDLGPSFGNVGGGGSEHRGSSIEMYCIKDSVFADNQFYNISNGIFFKQCLDGAPYGPNITIRNNTFWRFSGDAIALAGFGVNNTIDNNILMGIWSAYSLWIGSETSGNLIAHNLFIYSGNSSTAPSRGDPPANGYWGPHYYSWFGGRLDNSTEYNNILYNVDFDAVILTRQGTVAQVKDIDYNIYYDTSGVPKFDWYDVLYTSLASWRSVSGFDEHTITSNPLFMVTPSAFANPFSLNFNLQSTSPAIDAGIFIPGYHCALADDNGGLSLQNCRHWCGTAPDIGALEYCPATAGCSLPYDQPTCNCISGSELNNAISGWYTDSINIPQLMQIIKAWKLCSN